MARISSTFALVLCLSLLLQECVVRVQTAKVHRQKQDEDKGSHHKKHGERKDQESVKGTQDEKKPENPNEYQWVWLNDDNGNRKLEPRKQQSSSKRGWINNVFKIVKIGGKVTSITSSVAGLANSILRAIGGCCTDFPDACSFRDEFLEMKAKIEEQSERVDQLELQAQNIQVYTDRSIGKYEQVIHQLNEIENTLETFLESLSPEVSIALNNQTSRIKKLIQEKTEKGQEVEFMEISSLYETALDNALSIGFPVVGLAVPLAKKIYSFAKMKKAASSTATIETETVTFKDPRPSSPNHKQGRVSRWLSKGARQYYKQVNKIKVNLNQRFGRAFKIASKVYGGFKAALNYVSTGLNIYMIIASHESCRQRRDEARNARDELVKAAESFDEIEAELTDAKSIMEQSFQYLRGNLTHESTLGVIENIKTMVEGISSPSPDLIQVAIDLQNFITGIKEDTSLEGTYRQEENLVATLRKIPFTVRCYTEMNKLVTNVVDECKKGTEPFDRIYENQRENYDFGDGENPDSCARKTGYQYINKEDIENGWKMVAKEGNFNEFCLLNKPANRNTACLYLQKQGQPVEKIAKDMGITEADVQRLIEDCPEIKELDPSEKAIVCKLRVIALSNESIASTLSKDLKLVKAVEC